MKKYSIINWPSYNKSLVQRGNIRIWINLDDNSNWYSQEKTGKPGRPDVYSDDAILAVLIIRIVLHMTLRSAQGFLQSLMSDRMIPSYTQVCRRASSITLPKHLTSSRYINIIIDSTGVKVRGEGEWKVRQHGYGYRRTWKKLHVCVDADSHEIVAAEMTHSSVSDDAIVPLLFKQIPRTLKRCFGDGAYDTHYVRQAIYKKGAVAIIPPRNNARIHTTGDPSLQQRNDDIREIRGFGGDEAARSLWKKLTKYHTRSLVETAMYRIKTLTGASLRSRTQERQKVECWLKCHCVNVLTRLGMPHGEWKEVG